LKIPTRPDDKTPDERFFQALQWPFEKPVMRFYRQIIASYLGYFPQIKEAQTGIIDGLIINY
jgi:hypothetical protein